MNQWWSDLDEAILGCFTTDRPLAPAEIGHKLGISETGIASILGMLAREGKVRIALVELTDVAKRDGLGAGRRRSNDERAGGASPVGEPTFVRGLQATGRGSESNLPAELKWTRHPDPNPVGSGDPGDILGGGRPAGGYEG